MQKVDESKLQGFSKDVELVFSFSSVEASKSNAAKTDKLRLQNLNPVFLPLSLKENAAKYR